MTQISKLKQLGSEVEGLREKVRGFEKEWASAVQNMSARVEETAAAVGEAESQVESALGRLRETGDGVVEELIRLTETMADGPWKEALKEALLALTDGKATMFEVLNVFGEVDFFIDGTRTKLSLLLSEMDPRQYVDKAQEIRRLIEQETLGIEEILQLLGESVDAWGKSLVELYEAFREGRRTVEDVIREARRAQDALGPNSQTGALAEGLEDLLRRGLEDFG